MLESHEKTKLVQEMSALEELKRKLYGLKRGGKEGVKEGEKGEVRQTGSSQAVTPRCVTPISQK